MNATHSRPFDAAIYDDKKDDFQEVVAGGVAEMPLVAVEWRAAVALHSPINVN